MLQPGVIECLSEFRCSPIQSIGIAKTTCIQCLALGFSTILVHQYITILVILSDRSSICAKAHNLFAQNERLSQFASAAIEMNGPGNIHET